MCVSSAARAWAKAVDATFDGKSPELILEWRVDLNIIWRCIPNVVRSSARNQDAAPKPTRESISRRPKSSRRKTSLFSFAFVSSISIYSFLCSPYSAPSSIVRNHPRRKTSLYFLLFFFISFFPVLPYAAPLCIARNRNCRKASLFSYY